MSEAHGHVTGDFTWQALNALVFFLRDVCGKEEVELQVRMKRTERRMPVVLSRSEIRRLIEQIEPRYALAAMLQYGSGLRRAELVSLRVKDVDLERETITVRGGKGDRDYPLLRRRSAVRRSAPPHSYSHRRQGAIGGG